MFYYDTLLATAWRKGQQSDINKCYSPLFSSQIVLISLNEPGISWNKEEKEKMWHQFGQIWDE